MHRSSFDQRYVHKLDPWAVLVTGVRAPHEGAVLEVGTTWDVDVVLPLGVAHPVYAQQSAVLLALEAFRQSGTALAHVAGGVPLGHAFVATRVAMRWVLDPGALTGDVPARFTFTTLHAEHRRGTLVQHVFDAVVTVDGVVVAHASGDLQCVDPRVHARLRAAATPWQDARHRHDASILADVRTTPGTLDAALGWDADDRMTFDHGVDHLPAMHLARAAVTAHLLLTAADSVTAVDIRCTRYVELADVATVHAERTPGAGTPTSTRVDQGDPARDAAAVITCASEILDPVRRAGGGSGPDEPAPGQRRLGTTAV